MLEGLPFALPWLIPQPSFRTPISHLRHGVRMAKALACLAKWKKWGGTSRPNGKQVKQPVFFRPSEKNQCNQYGLEKISYTLGLPHPGCQSPPGLLHLLVGNRCKPSFATVTGWGVDPTYTFDVAHVFERWNKANHSKITWNFPMKASNILEQQFFMGI